MPIVSPITRLSLSSAPLRPDTTVRTVQRALTVIHYPLRDDGLFGPRTEEALRAFQRAQGLKPTGAIDLSTIREIAYVMSVAHIPPLTAEPRRTGTR